MIKEPNTFYGMDELNKDKIKRGFKMKYTRFQIRKSRIITPIPNSILFYMHPERMHDGQRY